MVLAASVAKCRFCDTEMPPGFWDDPDAPPRPPPPPASPSPMFPPERKVESRRPDSRLTPLPAGSRQSDMTPLPANLAPPSNLEQRRKEPLPDKTPPPGADPANAPGQNIASAALERELEAVISGTPLPQVLESVAPVEAPGPPPRTIPTDITPVDTRKLGFGAALVVVVLFSWAVYSASSGPDSKGVAQTCKQQCQSVFDESGLDDTDVNAHMNFMSRCVQECLAPKPDTAAGEGQPK